MKKSKLSADNFKKILQLDGSTPEPAIRSGNTGQRIPCFESCQLNTTLMSGAWAPVCTRSTYFVICGRAQLELHSKGPYPSSERETKFGRCMFTFSLKRAIRHFHVVFVHKRQRNILTKLRVQSCLKSLMFPAKQEEVKSFDLLT